MIKTFPEGGVHVEENKLSASKPIKTIPLPEVIKIPISQHIGKPSKPLVKRGDMVKTGQLIARSEGFVSANVHATVSGKVAKIDKVYDTSGYRRDAIIINVEGDEWVDTIERDDGLETEFSASSKEIIEKVLEAGIVGLGGATFPSHVKLSVPPGKKAEYLVVNGVECEPYLTADHRLMLEKGEQLIVGARIMQKALQAKKILIGIENNKPDAIENLRKISAKYNDIEVHALQVKYPQGGEKQLVKALLNREVPSGGLPIDVGVVAFNVGSILAAYKAVQKNQPLIERVVTVTGKNLKEPSNFWVRLGTPVMHLLKEAGGLPEDAGKVINGGPMMGKALNDFEAPIVKGSSGILVLPENLAYRSEVRDCIRCSRCISVCPMNLEPYLLMAMAQKEMYDRLVQRKIMDCMECGSCSYICPSKRPLLDYIRLGKNEAKKLKKK